MLKKIQRLTKDKEFDQIFKDGASSYNKLMGIKVLENELEYSRLGIIISNKVSKSAVKRNKLKRQLREIFKPRMEQLKKKYDIVVIVLPPAIDKIYQELEKATEQAFKKLKLC